MIYHQFVTIQTLLNKVGYGLQQILATWCIQTFDVIPHEQICTQMGHYFYYLIWVTYDQLFNLTHMAYSSRPLVRKFRILKIRRIDFLKLKSSRQFYEIDLL